MLLNLPSIIVTKTDEHGDHDYHIYAHPKELNPPCPDCGSLKLYGHGKRIPLIMDTPIHGRRVGIFLEVKRYKCRECKKTFNQPCEDINDSHRATNRLVKYIEEKAMIRPCTAIAEDIGVTEGTIRNILNAHIERLEKKYVFETPEILGIDEAHLNRKMRLVMTNIKERTIINLVKDRNKKTVINILQNFKDNEKIKIVAIDMWRPYRDAVRSALPNAMIVIDKFHVVKMANEAVDKGRKSLKDDMHKDLAKRLKKERFLMLKRRRDLTPVQDFQLSGWTLNYPDLFELYNAKEDFFDIWDSDMTRKEAEEAYLNWKMKISSQIMRHFSDLVRAVDNWHLEVFNYFDCHVTNAYTESANNQIKHIYKQGRGYSFDVLKARVLYVPEHHKKKKSFKYSVSPGKDKISDADKKSKLPILATSTILLIDEPELNLGTEILHMMEKLRK